MMFKNIPECELVRGVRVFTPIIHVFTPYVLPCGHECICRATSDHHRPISGAQASRPSSLGPQGTARPASCRSAPPLGHTDPPRAAGRSQPPDGPDGSASEAASRPLCALRAAASASRARLLSWPNRSRRLRMLARPRSDLELPQPSYWPQQQPPRQRLVAAERRPSGGLNACGARQTGLCESGEIKCSGWCNVWPVICMIVRMSRWSDACMYACILGSR